ncbi:Dolichyl-phosphate-mannose-protein mannosyltransferase [Gaiella occulta]|uniref:Dolichyl-phosphate-mannose-protein mannosyltransferase n=1 Tax=Gaiella occulta TaxID=1002870 RepID=A0A7M2YXV6_9ACTN|nr:glycosyltransferase family 39 protein [Gaiella occulta]RDI74307.1 Dolichyl-phosphate-mannose-protein mannosyltransferase [Gaiella occulta]
MGAELALRLRAVPPWMWLAAIVAASFGIRAWLARGMMSPFIVVDEIIYSELARSFAAGGDFLVRGVPTSGYGIVYPVLISPAYALFDALPSAYGAVKTINSLLMSLAAIPSYLLARRMLPVGLSLLAAVLAVGLPSLVYTATVMTENAFYPLFLLLVWLLVRMLERPSAGAQAALLLVLAIAFETRVQALALVPAILAAPALLVLFERLPLRSGLRPYRLVYALLVGGGIALVLLEVVRGRSPRELLGAYGGVGDGSYPLGPVLRYAAWHLEELTLYMGVLPLAASIVLVGLVRRQPRPVQAFVAAALPAALFMTVAVAAFVWENIPTRIQERNLFVIVPLFVLATLVWVHRGAPRPPALALPAAVLAVAMPLFFPYPRFIETGAISDALALLPIWAMFGHLLFDSIDWTIFAASAAAGLLFLLVPVRYALAVPLVVLAWWVAAMKPIWFGPYPYGFKQAGAGALFQGIRVPDRDWIDAALPAGATAAAVWTGSPDRFVVNVNEFFNRKLARVYYTGAPTPGNLPETKLDFDPATRAFTLAGGTPFAPRYVLVDNSIDPGGEIVARDGERGMTLWRLDGPFASVSRVEGLYPNDTWSGETVVYTRGRCRGGTVAVGIWTDPGLFKEPQVVTATQNGRVTGRFTVDPTGRRGTFRVRLEPVDGRCRVEYAVSPTANPAVVLGNGDDRVLGAHFDGFVLER